MAPALRSGWSRLVAALSHPMVEAGALLLARLSLASVFWRSGRAKVEEGTWLSISPSTWYLFENDYSGVPLPPDVAAVLAVSAEHLFPLLLLVGLATRLSALALLAMTLVIQIFVYPEAWWPVHSLWAALALVLVSRGGGARSLDALFSRRFA